MKSVDSELGVVMEKFVEQLCTTKFQIIKHNVNFFELLANCFHSSLRICECKLFCESC